jgi:hypothetical protein
MFKLISENLLKLYYLYSRGINIAKKNIYYKKMENLLITGKPHHLLVEMKTTNGMFMLNKKMESSVNYL